MKASEIVRYLSCVPDEEDFVLLTKKRYMALNMLACRFCSLMKYFREFDKNTAKELKPYKKPIKKKIKIFGKPY